MNSSKIWRWEVITGLCLINGFRIGAELGVSGGRFTSFLLSRLPDAKMIAVDLWDEQPPRDEEGAETYTAHNLPAKYEFLKKTWDEHFPERVRMMRMRTVEAAQHVNDGSLDFVFIDADHSYSGCKADIEAWAPKVRKGGLIAGHDLNWPTVKKAVDEKYERYVIYPDNVWAASNG